MEKLGLQYTAEERSTRIETFAQNPAPWRPFHTLAGSATGIRLLPHGDIHLLRGGNAIRRGRHNWLIAIADLRYYDVQLMAAASVIVIVKICT